MVQRGKNGETAPLLPSNNFLCRTKIGRKSEILAEINWDNSCGTIDSLPRSRVKMALITARKLNFGFIAHRASGN